MAAIDWANAIKSIESAGSGGYSAVGPETRKGNRAYGAYQVMDFNVGPWTEKHLGQRLTPEQFLQNPEAQDAVFNGEFGSSVEQYGNPQDAASIWFTGKPASQGANRADVLGTTGAGYVDKFNRALGSGGLTVSTKGTQNMPAAPQQTAPLSALDRLKGKFIGNPDTKDRLIMALQGMTLRPNQGMIDASAAAIQGRAQAQGKEQQANATAEWLSSKGRDDLAEGVRTGAIPASAAIQQAMAAPEDSRTSLVKNFEYAVDNGYEGTLQDFMQANSGGTTVNIDQKGASKFEEAFATGDAKTVESVSNLGMQAARNMSRIDKLQSILETAPSGAEGAFKSALGDFGIETEGLDNLQAAGAIINSLVPEQRQAGSGPMSDADLELFKKSLPRIINTPQGNAQIIDTIRSIAEYDMQGAQVVQSLRAGDIDRAQAFQMLQERKNPLDGFKAPAATKSTTPSGENPYAGIDAAAFSQIDINSLSDQELDQLMEAWGQ